MKFLKIGLLILTAFFFIPTIASAHPGGGLIAMDANTVIFADPTNNVVWRLEKGRKSQPLMKSIHPHWVTRGMDGHIYAEGFQEMGGALFRVDPGGANHVKIAEEKDLKALVFAVGKRGELIFQKGAQIMERASHGTVTRFRGKGEIAKGEPALQEIIAYAWADDETLYLSDGGNLRRIGKDGIVRLVAKIEGKLIEPKIWNSTNAPRIWSITIDKRKRIYAALPDIGQVVRIDADGSQRVIDQSAGGWRVTAVAAFGDSVFLLESPDATNDGQRVRVVRGSEKGELLGQVEP